MVQNQQGSLVAKEQIRRDGQTNREEGLAEARDAPTHTSRGSKRSCKTDSSSPGIASLTDWMSLPPPRLSFSVKVSSFVCYSYCFATIRCLRSFSFKTLSSIHFNYVKTILYLTPVAQREECESILGIAALYIPRTRKRTLINNTRKVGLIAWHRCNVLLCV